MVKLNNFDAYSRQYNNLILRERVILLLALLCCIYFIWNWFLINPIKAKTNQLLADIDYLEAVNNDLLSDTSAANKDYDDDFENLKSKLAAVQKKYEQIKNEVIVEHVHTSDDVISVVAGLVKKVDSIVLKNIEVQATEYIEMGASQNIYSTETAIALSHVNSSESTDIVNHRDTGILKHRIYAEFRGGYKDLTDYLKQIEYLEWQVFIESIHFSVERHPIADISIVFYSFSIGERLHEQ